MVGRKCHTNKWPVGLQAVHGSFAAHALSAWGTVLVEGHLRMMYRRGRVDSRRSPGFAPCVLSCLSCFGQVIVEYDTPVNHGIRAACRPTVPHRPDLIAAVHLPFYSVWQGRTPACGGPRSHWPCWPCRPADNPDEVGARYRSRWWFALPLALNLLGGIIA